MDLAESLRVLGSVRPVILMAATAVFLTGYPIRALRWRRILWSQKALSTRETLVPVFVGYMANNVLPARAGELYRAHFLGRRVGMSRSGAVASIVVERAFDGLMLVVVVTLVFFLFPQEHFLGVAAFFTMLAFLVLAFGILLYVLVAERAHWLVERSLGLLPRALEERVSVRLKMFLLGIRGVSTIRGLLVVGAYTAVIWMLEICAYSLAIAAFDVSLPLGGFLLVYALAALGTTLPAGPGYIGPYQYAFVLGLGVFAVSRETALAVSVAAQLALLGSVTLIGLVLLWRDQLRVKRPAESEGHKEDKSPSYSAKRSDQRSAG